jgi:hypothetical protein
MPPEILEQLMRRIGFESVETRRMDSLDFVETAVWTVRQALEDAYQRGRESVDNECCDSCGVHGEALQEIAGPSGPWLVCPDCANAIPNQLT